MILVVKKYNFFKHINILKEITNLIKEKAKADVSPSQIILKDELNKVEAVSQSIPISNPQSIVQ